MHLKRQLSFLYLYSFASSMRPADAVWVALLAARGFSLWQIGLAEGVFHVVSLLAEVPSGMAADLLGRRRTLAVSGVLAMLAGLTMVLARGLGGVCLSMGCKALSYNLMSGTQEALTYDSLKTAGQTDRYIQVDANVNLLQWLASGLGALASLLADVLRFAGYYLAETALGLARILAALGLREPVVTARQAARGRFAPGQLPARLRTQCAEAAACLRASPRAARLLAADAVIGLPGYLTTMFLQQRLVELGWPAAWLCVPALLSSLAGMAGATLGRRLAPGRLRPLYLGCALAAGAGTLAAGAGPAAACVAGVMLVQAAVTVWMLHAMQQLNDCIPSDLRATLISMDSMAYSLLMIPVSPLVGALGDAFGHAGAGLCLLGAAVAAAGLLAFLAPRRAR